MKQTVTANQLDKLNDSESAILEQWCNSKGILNLSIGQMIEFIQEKRPTLKGVSVDRFGKWFVTIDTVQHSHKDELCDALWEAITRILKADSESV